MHKSTDRLQTIYLWRAWQSEPGCDGARYTGTLDRTRPSPVQPSGSIPGLVDDESMYGDWNLVGATTGFLVEDSTGELVVENRSGARWDIETIVHTKHYRKML